MRIDGSVSENLLGDFLPENDHLHSHFGLFLLNFGAGSILSMYKDAP